MSTKAQTKPEATVADDSNITFASYKERVAAIKGESKPEPAQPKLGFITSAHLAATRVQAAVAVHADMHPVMVENAKQEILDDLIKSGAV